MVHTGLVFGLFVSLALLGLSAIDPVGIAAMPILLLQKHPYRRSLIFLSGSFISLMVMGLLFARGLGAIVLHFERTNSWLVPSAELFAGVVLLSISGTILWRMKNDKFSVDPPVSMIKRLRLGDLQLFIVGALLVAIQSIIDVVFVIAMIRIGQFHLHFITLTGAVATYAITALVLQFTVILAFWLTPPIQRNRTLDKVHGLLVKYADRTLVGISFLLGCGLLVFAGQN